jgi:hypothetical protein
MFTKNDGSWDWQTIGLAALLVYVATEASRAVRTIKRTIEKANNFGLTDEEDKAAAATLGNKNATADEKRAAIAKLRIKVDGAKAAGYGKQVRAADVALTYLQRELDEQPKLDAAREGWEKRNPGEAKKLKVVKAADEKKAAAK